MPPLIINFFDGGRQKKYVVIDSKYLNTLYLIRVFSFCSKKQTAKRILLQHPIIISQGYLKSKQFWFKNIWHWNILNYRVKILKLVIKKPDIELINYGLLIFSLSHKKILCVTFLHFFIVTLAQEIPLVGISMSD